MPPTDTTQQSTTRRTMRSVEITPGPKRPLAPTPDSYLPDPKRPRFDISPLTPNAELALHHLLVDEMESSLRVRDVKQVIDRVDNAADFDAVMGESAFAEYEAEKGKRVRQELAGYYVRKMLQPLGEQVAPLFDLGDFVGGVKFDAGGTADYALELHIASRVASTHESSPPTAINEAPRAPTRKKTSKKVDSPPFGQSTITPGSREATEAASRNGSKKQTRKVTASAVESGHHDIEGPLAERSRRNPRSSKIVGSVERQGGQSVKDEEPSSGDTSDGEYHD